MRLGQKVRAGQRLATSGKTGRTRGPHLHFEVRRGVTAVDPMIFMSRVQSASLDRGAGREIASPSKRAKKKKASYQAVRKPSKKKKSRPSATAKVAATKTVKPPKNAQKMAKQ